jgi:hypothetical protein
LEGLSCGGDIGKIALLQHGTSGASSPAGTTIGARRIASHAAGDIARIGMKTIFTPGTASARPRRRVSPLRGTLPTVFAGAATFRWQRYGADLLLG